MVFVLSSALSLADVLPFASTRFKTTSCYLPTSLNLSASVSTYDDCDELGVKSYALYKSNGTKVMSASPEDYEAGHKYSFSVDLSGYASSGTSYYAVVTFYADGETRSQTSGTVRF